MLIWCAPKFNFWNIASLVIKIQSSMCYGKKPLLYFLLYLHCSVKLKAQGTYRFYQTVCTSLFVAMFMPKVAWYSQISWRKCPIGNIRVICVPGTPMQGRQAAVHVFSTICLVHLDKRCIIWRMVLFGWGGWWSGPRTCWATGRISMSFSGIQTCNSHDLRKRWNAKYCWQTYGDNSRELEKEM